MMLPNPLLVLRAALAIFTNNNGNTFKGRGPTQGLNGQAPVGGGDKGDNPKWTKL